MKEKIDSSDLSIESAQIHDLGKLTRIMIAAYENLSNKYLKKTLGPPGYDSLRAHMDWLARDDYCKILYKNKIVGGFILQKYFNSLFLGMIFIAVPYQRKGIGTQVLKYLENVSKYNEIVLNTPEWAIHNQKYFENHGFMRFKTEYDPNLGFVLYYYKKNLR